MSSADTLSDLRFNKLLSWNTFPLPSLSQAAIEAIAAAGAGVREARENQGVPLSEMYPHAGPPAKLQAAHDILDREIDRAFGLTDGWPLTELDRQGILFKQYAERFGNSQSARPQRTPN